MAREARDPQPRAAARRTWSKGTTKTRFKVSSKVEDSLAVLRLGLCGLPAEGEGSIPDPELRPCWLWGCDP